MQQIAAPTNELLTRERNQFWAWVLGAVAIGLVITGASGSTDAGKVVLVTVLIWRV